MRQYIIIFILTILTACSNEKQNDNSNTTEKVQADSFSLEQQPAKTVIDFLKWYRDNQDIQSGLVNNASGDIYDSTKFYSVNFEATKIYLLKLKSTGFISDLYIDKWKKYFEKCDSAFARNPENDGPPAGFEYDFIMLSQEYDEDLKNVEKTKIISNVISGNNAAVKLYFPSGSSLNYKLTKRSDKWAIDDIK